MHSTHSRARRGGRTLRCVAPLAAAVVVTGALAGPAHAQTQDPLTVDAVKDSVIATGLPFGATTIQVTRPDALTRAPVVIGQFAGFAFPTLPFSVNTTTPTPLLPGGDCWQKGALSLPGGVGLTPDIRGGDTVRVANGGPSLNVSADAESEGDLSGPIAGCKPISAFGRNNVTAATGDPGADLSVSGNSQFLTTDVAVTATDGQATTTPVDATLAADGTWTATIPAHQLGKLADGRLTLNGVYAVPDVATGASAHITGAPLAAEKTSPAGGVEVTPAPAAPAPAAPATPAPKATAGRLTAIQATTRISLAHARKGGIRVAWTVPAGAKVVRVRLSHNKNTEYLKFVTAAAPGSRQTVNIKSASLARKLRRGTSKLSVMAGPSRTELGQALTSNIGVR
jgi:hypothetical protein